MLGPSTPLGRITDIINKDNWVLGSDRPVCMLLGLVFSMEGNFHFITFKGIPTVLSLEKRNTFRRRDLEVEATFCFPFRRTTYASLNDESREPNVVQYL